MCVRPEGGLGVSNDGIPPLDPRRIKALGDRTRVRILELLNQQPASAPELAQEMRVSQSLVNYHLQVLMEGECVEISTTSKRHGRPTRLYAAKPGSALTALAINARSALSDGNGAATILAVETLTLTAPHRLTADQILRSAVADLRDLHEQSRRLNTATDAVLVPVEVGIAMFEAPQP